MVEILTIAFIAIVACVVVWVLLATATRVRACKPMYTPYKDYFLRLGRCAPHSPCPCGSGRNYGPCCRPRDVTALRAALIDLHWRRWSHRSYAGRRRSASMGHRLEDHRLPRIVMPDWVESPDRFEFPVSEDTVRSWNPCGSAVVHESDAN
ncbi:MAG: hypothetical protein DCC65_07365 [Planctomycetota bacterium]|nr:MAG: hypothetical protein DCC65_07365 [Planctomycetota bacterium]